MKGVAVPVALHVALHVVLQGTLRHRLRFVVFPVALNVVLHPSPESLNPEARNPHRTHSQPPKGGGSLRIGPKIEFSKHPARFVVFPVVLHGLSALACPTVSRRAARWCSPRGRSRTGEPHCIAGRGRGRRLRGGRRGAATSVGHINPHSAVSFLPRRRPAVVELVEAAQGAHP